MAESRQSETEFLFELRTFIEEILEDCGCGVYYATEAGADKLMEWLAERGVLVLVTVTDEGTFDYEFFEETGALH